MSQRHLYGESYDEMNPPQGWEALGVQATIEDQLDFNTETLTTTDFIFVGDVAKWVRDFHIPAYGVFNGVRYRIEVTDDITGTTVNIFDGFINLRDREILSEEPYSFRAPVVDFNDNATIFEQISIYTQGLLLDQGFLNSSDFVDVPTIIESKKNVAERTLILTGLLSDTVGLFIRLIQDFMSALSDILGISLPVGVVELLLLFINAVIEIDLLTENILTHKDLFFPNVTYYKGVKLKSVIEKSFAKLGKAVEFGEIDGVLNNIVLLGSQFNNSGSPISGIPFTDGILKSTDYGYRVGEAMETMQTIFNVRYDVRDDVVHVKNKFDPFWTTEPEVEIKNILNETTKQYNNGTKKEDTDEIYGTVFVSYISDPTDGHTLTQREGKTHEVRRDLITELDPKLNLMRGIKDLQINYALAVRKEPFDNLIDLFMGVNDEFDYWLNQVQDQITEYLDDIPESAGVGSYVSEILSNAGLSAIIEGRTGTLKIEDNSYNTPKLIYLDDTGRIPSNFKDFVGAPAIYNNYHLKDSPADINDFKGQKVKRLGWRIPFNADQYVTTKTNPYFELGENNLKFTSITWVDDSRDAITEVEQQSTFDTNITEYVIETPE